MREQLQMSRMLPATAAHVVPKQDNPKKTYTQNPKQHKETLARAPSFFGSKDPLERPSCLAALAASA